MSLLPYVPTLALRLLGEAPTPHHVACAEPVDASVLLADISGFTALVDTMSREHGDRGAERLQETLNRCFGPLTDLVDDFGGEVLAFPGDAVLAIWTRTNTDTTALAGLVHQTAQCGLALQQRLSRFRTPEEADLRLRVAVGAGRAWAALVGGAHDWAAILQGDAVNQLSGALEASRPGEVVLSPAARALAGGSVTGQPRHAYFVVSGAQEVRPPRRHPARAVADDIVRSLVPAPISSRIDAGQQAWLAEFRSVTVTFVQVNGIKPDDLATLQAVTLSMQSIVGRFGGVIDQIVADEKGLTFVLAIGVAQRAHEDDAARAVRTGLAVRAALSDLGVDARLGLSTGRVFSGVRGGRSRLELAILGTSVVLAARLAGAAQDLLCDGPTRTASRKTIRFESLPSVALKGKASPVEVWRPFAVKSDEERDGTGIIGRLLERAVLEGCVTRLERHGAGGVVVLEGEPGIGKTALVHALRAWTRSRAVRWLAGGGDSIEQRTAYRPWRTIMSRAIGTDGADDEQTVRGRLETLLGNDNSRWLSLLNPVLAAAQPENDHTLSLDADSRGRMTRELLVTLLDTAARGVPLLVVLEDAHWMDSASWDLAEHVVARLPRTLVLITVRPPVDGIAALTRLRMRPDATTLHVGPLGADEVRELVCRRLDADAIPEQVAALIQGRSEGHPLFAAELSLALRDRGTLLVRDGTCQLSFAAEVSTVAVPDTVHGIVATRIDQLTPQEQLTLKVAAVLGKEFSLIDLAEVHPLGVPVEILQAQAARMSGIGLLAPSSAPQSFVFTHAVIQEVAYELLPFNQRRELHRRTAEGIERANDRTPEGLSPLLAHHWERAEVAERAMHYLELASERALLRDSSNREAEDFLTRLLALADSARPLEMDEQVDVPGIGRLSARAIKLARWERQLAQALARQGRHAEGLRHLERSISLLGHQVPINTWRVLSELLLGMTARLVRIPRVRGSADPSQAGMALLEMSRSYEKLVEYRYLGQSLVLSAVATLRSVRAAELAGPSVELSRVYSLFANLMAMCRRPKLARHYSERGRAIALEVGDRHALFRALTFGQMPSYIRGQWQETAAAFEQAVALAGDLRIVHESLLFEYSLAAVHFNQGQLEQALARLSDVRARARQHDALVPQLWSTVAMGEVALRQGRLSDAISLAEETLELASSTASVDQNCRFQAHGLLASAWLQQAGLDRARHHIAPAIAAAEAGARLSYAAQSGFIGVAEVLLALADTGKEQEYWRPRLRRWLRTLRLMAFCRPILEPWDLIFRAAWNRRNGRSWIATRHLRKAIELADRMQLAYESGVARADLGGMMRADRPERRAILEEACSTFERMGAARALHDARALLAECAPVRQR